MSRVRVPCPTCGRVTEAEESVPLPPWFPFCTDRCRLLDLGKWFDEEYRVSRPEVPRGLDLPDEPATD